MHGFTSELLNVCSNACICVLKIGKVLLALINVVVHIRKLPDGLLDLNVKVIIGVFKGLNLLCENLGLSLKLIAIFLELSESTLTGLALFLKVKMVFR